MNKRHGHIIYLLIANVVLFFIIAGQTMAGMEIMSDDELAALDGQFSSVTIDSFYNENDTVRIFLDLHLEVYGTIDSVKAGYYYRDAASMRTNMAQIGMSGFQQFYDVQKYASNDGAYFNFAKIESDFNTLAPQGAGTIEPWGNGGYLSKESTVTPNTNFYDWDLWIDNIKLGESPDKPMYMNGQIIRLEFDNSVYAENSHLRRIIIGTNDQQGNFYSNMQRYTGIVNPMLLAYTAGRSAGVADPYTYTPGTMQMVRDSFIQCFAINVFNVEDRDTGFWVIMNFEGDHVGFEMICGLPENAIDFSYTEGLKEGASSIPLWDPDWTPYKQANGIAHPLEDPYHTFPQSESHNQGP
ncbi:MAG: hypothetical protein KKD44_22890 [Proteobacteria bacterium]|nr:hypothetical protein [Pseudomonadota bacterium]